eukprot:TRINITY_DN91896_c0_g1_i1.p1 TRINITY_DN91896_c0_g1~~TRINITY_DN91896_c0_g1_i1.p1  ORF type:complete len:547 (+),score=144.78 TRINITY_DN91896_c0_g1_i1:69-1709(+)
MGSFRRRCALALGVLNSLSHASESTTMQAPVVASVVPQRNSTAAPAEPSERSIMEHAAAIVGGVTDGFLGSSRISASERRCLSASASMLAAYITQTCGEAVGQYRQTSLASAPAAVSTSAADGGGVTAGPAEEVSPMTQGEDTVLAMAFSARLVGILNLEKRLAAKCLEQDAVEEFNVAAAHFANASYVGGRLVANGVDVVRELGGAMQAYDEDRFEVFGKDLGTAWRKVLLSKKSDIQLEVPTPAAVREVTQGLLASFFGAGIDVEITARDATAATMYAATPPPHSQTAWVGDLSKLRGSASPGTPWTPQEEVQQQTQATSTTIDLDVRKCVGENMPLFQSAWSPVWKFLANAAESGVESAPLPDVSWLLTSMLDVQVALRSCGITPVQEAMLFDALHSGSVATRVSLPGMTLPKLTVVSNREKATREMTEALQDWRMHAWTVFGRQLGELLRDMVMMAFPEKYSIGTAGRLQGVIEDAEAEATDDFSKNGRPNLIAALGLVVGVAAVGGLAFRHGSYAAVAVSPEAESVDSAMLASDVEAPIVE